jgi:excisionase family DNA binding protein
MPHEANRNPEAAQADNPMSYTLGEAAKAAGFSKPTLSRAIKNGKISATRLDDGSYKIDAAELERWKDSNGHRNSFTKRIITPSEALVPPVETPDSRVLQIEVATFREQLRSAETARRFLEERVSDLQERVERAEAKEDKLLALIAHLRPRKPEPASVPPPPAPRRGLWARLIG